MAGSDSSATALEAWKSADVRTHWVPIDSLVRADSPRLDGEDSEHTRMLAEAGAKLPPIIVHRSTMQVIDGMHRLGAARLRGDDVIEVRFFEGTPQEAFVLAVQTNIAHGRPLSLADRTKAAERIIKSHPVWADRAIAAAAGLGARTVGEIRRRIEAHDGITRQDGITPEGGIRIGRDGRARPLDNAAGRLRASEIIKHQPDASVRQIAKWAGVSPTTALDVRNRMRSGEDPVPRTSLRDTDQGGEPESEQSRDRSLEEAELADMFQDLHRDPELRVNESGRNLLRWILSRAIRPGEWQDMSERIPNHCTYIIADVARNCADEWRRVAEYLEKRAQTVG